MAKNHIPHPHTDEWYDNLAEVQQGYYYPWNSTKSEGNGEDAYLQMVKQHLTPDCTVLEVGCGHGEVALELAPLCKKIIAYDRVASYIDLAKNNARQKDISNVEFLCHDAKDLVHEQITLPAKDDSIDLIISRRGPLHWLEDARRVGHPGTVLIQLCPMEEPIPAWSSKLPHIMHYDNCARFTGSGSIRQSVENRLNQNGLTLHSGWGFDVPEIFEDPREVYKVLTWGLPADEIPPYEDVEHRAVAIFERYAEKEGIILRHCRYLWKAIIT
jgi:SAM-dependent methyltransferase